MRIAVLIALVTLPCFAQQPPFPRLIAMLPQLSLTPEYVGIGTGTRCGDDWFFLYLGEWACLRPQGDRFAVISAGAYSGAQPIGSYQLLVRGPTAFDHKVYTATSFFGIASAHSIDPMTGARADVGTLPQLPQDPPVYADHDGDGNPELIGISQFSSSLIALPGGPHPPFQWLATTDVKVILSGQFDSDPQLELGYLTSGALRFRDAATLADEPWAPFGSFVDYRPAWTGDWDGDGRDEVAMPTETSLALLDPSTPGAYHEPSLPQNIWRALGLLNWSAPGSRELVALGNTRLAVVDPRTDAVLLSQPLPLGNVGRLTVKVLDWDADGDEDMIWFDAGSLRLLRNPEGAQILQWSDGESHALGYDDSQREQRLVVVTEAGPELRVRQLNPRSLALRKEVVITNATFPAAGGLQSPRFLLGDFHPGPGKEILRVSETKLRAYALDGTQLWERVAQGRISSVQLSEGVCVGTACPPIALMEYVDSAPAGSVMRVLDGANGSTTWSFPPSAELLQLYGFTDVSGDGAPELIVIVGQGSTQRMRAIAATDGHALWDVPLDHPHFVRAVRRTGNKLAVLFADTTLALFRTDGTALNRRLLQIDGHCANTNCRMSFLSRAPALGDWVISANTPGYLAVREDLIGEVTTAEFSFDYRSLQFASPTLMNGVSNSRVMAWELDDRILDDGFED